MLIPNCDKIVPAMLMAAARLNIPSIVVSGGPMMPGCHNGEEISLSKMFEAVGSYKAGIIDGDELKQYELGQLPRMRQLLGNVYRQLDELSERGHWYGAARKWYHPCGT